MMVALGPDDARDYTVNHSLHNIACCIPISAGSTLVSQSG